RSRDSRLALAGVPTTSRSTSVPAGIKRDGGRSEGRRLCCRAGTLKLPQVGEKCRALLWRGMSIEVHAIRGSRRGRDAGWRNDLHALEELDVVIDHLFQRRGAVV